MRVLYDEDIASHIGPEPCVVPREGQGEASAGERAAPDLIRGAKEPYPGCRRCYQAGRQYGPLRYREQRNDSAWSETPACTDAPCAGTGRSPIRPAAQIGWSAPGR